MNLTDYFAMGGYGAYVWPCFLLTGAVLVWNVIAARRQHADARRQALRRLDAAGSRS